MKYYVRFFVKYFMCGLEQFFTASGYVQHHGLVLAYLVCGDRMFKSCYCYGGGRVDVYAFCLFKDFGKTADVFICADFDISAGVFRASYRPPRSEYGGLRLDSTLAVI